MSKDSLCVDCVHTRLVQGGRYYLCMVYKDRVRSEKYPYQPVDECEVYATIGEVDSSSGVTAEA